MPVKARASVQSVERAIALLKSFTADDPELGIAQLSRRVGLPKSTVFRLVLTLEAGGLIAQNPETGRYQLGLDLIGLANNVIAYADVRRVSRPHLRTLANTIQDTVSLSALEHNEAINLEQVVPPGKMIMRVGWVGRHMPAHAVSAGKVIVAFLDSQEWPALFKNGLQGFTPHTITDPAALHAELEQVRADGYATAFEELEEGLHALAAPVFNHEKRVIASISVSGPAYRLSRERVRQIAPQVIQTAQQISKEMGFPSEP